MKKTLQLVGLVLLSNSLTLNTKAQEVCFLPQGSFATGVAPVGTASADFNNDGNMDIVSTNQTGTFSILLGNGAGGFGAATTSPVGASSYGVSTGDFNEDGNEDIAVTHLVMAGTLSVMLGNGDGTFGAVVNYTASSVPREIEIEDYNNDGHLDLAVCNTGSTGPFPSLSILLGTGTGTFGAASFYFVAGVNGGAFSITDGDFDNDDDLDIALAVTDSGAVIMENNGSGVFTEGANFLTLTDFYGICSDDFNSDGDADLAVVDNVLNNVTILLGNGNMTFATGVTIPVGSGPRSIANADFNNDGNPDLVVSNYASASVSVIVGNAAGTFGSVNPFTVDSSPNAVCIADFNNDTKTDINTVNQAAFTTSVLINNAPTILVNTSVDTLCISQSATLTASGGSTYDWSTGASGSNISVNPNVDSDYFVLGADITGCEYGFTFTQLVENCGLGFGEFDLMIENFNVYPNPTSDNISISSNQLSNGKYILTIQNIIGEIILTDQFQIENNLLQKNISLDSLPRGIYFVVLENENSKQIVKLVKE